MMNLTDLEKKWLSNSAMILGALLIIGFSYWGISSLVFSYKQGALKAKKEIIERYEKQIDSLRITNQMVTYQVDSIEKEVLRLKKQKEYVYVTNTATDELIKDADMTEHAEKLDTLTQQNPTWAVVKDSTTQDTIIKYNFTKTGIVKLRLSINYLKQYQKLYQIDEKIITKQDEEITLQKTIITNDKVALNSFSSALSISQTENERLTKQLNKAQKKAGNWPYWLGGGFVGGLAVCLLAR